MIIYFFHVLHKKECTLRYNSFLHHIFQKSFDFMVKSLKCKLHDLQEKFVVIMTT